jgi:hypothetical protein
VSRVIKNCYVRVPTKKDSLALVESVRALLAEADSGGARIQYRRGDEWICLQGAGFTSLNDSRRIEAQKLLTRQCADEVVMVAGYSGVNSGMYGRFVRGELVRFVACSEDWAESVGTPEPWESEIIDPSIGITDFAVYEIGDRLRLPGCRDLEVQWDVDLVIPR